MSTTSPNPSPFFHAGSASTASSLSILHLRRDLLLPVFLRENDIHDSGYAEGCVTNTRFGSYPHSTLIGLPWGSQVLASKVDTGSRGRRPGGVGDIESLKQAKRKFDEVIDQEGDGASLPTAKANTTPERRQKLESYVAQQIKLETVVIGQEENPKQGKKRKQGDDSAKDVIQDDRASTRTIVEHTKKQNILDEAHIGQAVPEKQQKQAVAASSGFCHILPPTPESWTLSLPHRTQVVYTPDYSYILQKLRVRPGSIVIEAGAGSGSFTHAAARAVYHGYPSGPGSDTTEAASKKKRHHHYGKVYSFEYHEPRAQQLQAEVVEHGLQSIVQVTHRDVYQDGFNVSTYPDPAPDTANPSTPPTITSPHATAIFLDLPAPWLALPHLTRVSPSPNPTISPLDPSSAAHLCAFLPCIEQTQRTISTLRQLCWTGISMQELAHRRIDVKRERVGLELEGLRGVNASPGSVEEAVERLLSLEKGPGRGGSLDGGARDGAEGEGVEVKVEGGKGEVRRESRMARLARIAKEAESRKPWREGRLVHRTEPEVKTHTSYLVFAVMPRAWSEDDEKAARERWPVGRTVEGGAKGVKHGKGPRKEIGKGKKVLEGNG